MTVLVNNHRNVKCSNTFYRVYFYNQNVEVDFVVYDEGLAFQVSYSLGDPDTEKREVDALVKLNKVLPMRQLTIITKEEERNIMAGDVAIHVVPVWKWMLDVSTSSERFIENATHRG